MSTVQTMERGGLTSGLDFPELIKPLLEINFLNFQPREKTLYAGMPDWFSEVDDRLHSFSQLKDNWDSYGASPIHENLITQAFQLLLKSNLDNVSKPFVVPRKDGGINFEWDSGEKFLSLEIRKDGMEYFFFNRKTEKPVEKKFQEESLDSLIKEFL